MSKIKFSLIDSYDGNIDKYVLLFIIHEQDMNWRQGDKFVSSAGVKVITTAYNYICNIDAVYLRSNKVQSYRTFKCENTSINFDNYESLILHKNKIINAIKEWSNE